MQVVEAQLSHLRRDVSHVAEGRDRERAGDLPETTQASGAEHDDDLTDALGRLPGRQKQAVAYHYLAGLPYADVAAIFSDVLERAITFHPRTAEEDRDAMIAAGIPAPIAEQNAQAFTLIATGDAEWLSDDAEKVLGQAVQVDRVALVALQLGQA